MEYCLSILYVAMDELGMIWCMDAFMERRYKDWKFWVTFTISMAVSFYLFNFVVSGITILHTLIAYAMFFIWSYLLWKKQKMLLCGEARRRIKTIGSTVGRDLWIH